MAYPLDILSFPLHGTRLIEASAGTGKTYTIAALYLRLVLGHGGENGFSRALMPPEILVVTFTHAATQELRDRIRNRLAEAASFFRGKGDGDDYLINLRNTFDTGRLPAKASMLDQAAQWMDEAAIYTIHGWCQRMLSQHAFDSGSLFDLALQTDEQELLEAAACDYWRCHFYPQAVGRLLELRASVGCATPQELLEKIRPLLNGPKELSADPFGMMDQRGRAIEAARRVWERDLDGAVNQLREARENKRLNGNKYRADSVEKWIEQVNRWVTENGPLPESTAREKFSSAGLRAGTSKNKETPVHPAYDAFDRLGEVLEGMEIETALFNHAANEIARRLRTEKERRAQMGFDDLLIRLHDALQKPENDRLAEVIREQFPVALIDEFQDTDPVQYAAFSKVYLGREATGLFLIGDPKQAIYGFRGADIHTYLTAREDTSRNHYTLGKNYRSTVGMVHGVNRIFQAGNRYADGAFLFKDQIPFEAVDAQGRKEELVVDGKPVQAINLWQMAQDGPVKKTGDDGYIGTMAKAAASEITRLLNLGEAHEPKAGFRQADGKLTPLRPADIAILVRDGREARAIRGELDRRQVRSVYLSDKDSVFDSGEAQSLLYLLRACAEPEQERCLKSALATPILDLPLAYLDRLNRDEEAWELEVARFWNYKQIWQRRGVLPMMRSLLREFDVPARLISMTGGERILTNLLHLSEMLQAAATDLDGEQGLIRWLSEQIGQPGSGREDLILRLESDEELVRVVTIHKSKGLEYPLVFLPFICSFRPVTAKNAPVVKIHDEDGRMMVVQKPDEKQLVAADRERLAEDLRLLYVALTRPRYACWLGVGVMGRTLKKGEKSELHLSGIGYLLSGGAPIPTAGLSEKLVELKGDCSHISIGPLPEIGKQVYRPGRAEADLQPAREFRGKIPRDWWITSYSGILAGASMPEMGSSVEKTDAYELDSPDCAAEDQLQETGSEILVAPEIEPHARSIHTFPRGPHPGTFLHGLLEWAATEGFGVLADDRQRIVEKVDRLCKHRDLEPWATVLTDWLHRLLRLPLELPEGQGTFTLAELNPADYQSELEFLFAAHRVDAGKLDGAVTGAIQPGVNRPQLRGDMVNGMLKGFVDFVFLFNGRYYVTDYKSNYLGDDEKAYGKKAMAEGMLEHRYDLQYVLYTLALHRLLKARIGEDCYDYDRDMGGVVYLFLRGIDGAGQGVYADKPPRMLIEMLDDYFAGEENAHAA